MKMIVLTLPYFDEDKKNDAKVDIVDSDMQQISPIESLAKKELY